VTRTPLLLVGAGGHARACIDVIEQEGRFEVAGLLGLPEEIGRRILGYAVLGSDVDLLTIAARVGHAIVTVGQIKSAQVRVDLFAQLVRSGCALPTIVSPRGYVSRHATVGAGTIVMHGAIVNAGASIGRNCILNSLALVEHDANVADHCHISTSAAVNSAVRIGTGTFVGSGASVHQGIVIGERCVIPMGLAVRSDCRDGEQLSRASVA
jgi:sugar O-acyltransferase (sialic acid O-acetyltransferase NeuD family)